MPTQVKVPEIGESVKEAILIKWHKKSGERVRTDDPLCELETDKANVDVPASTGGVLKQLKPEGKTVNVGEIIAEIESDGAARNVTAPPETVAAPSAPAAPPVQPKAPSTPPPAPPPPIAAKPPEATAPKRQPPPKPKPEVAEAPPPALPPRAAESKPEASPPSPVSSMVPAPTGPAFVYDDTGIYRQPMSKIRKRIAQTLVQAQQTAAILTTFNEVDCTAIIELRNKFKERFQEVYGVQLGFMSFFARATVLALKEFSHLNAFMDGEEIVYHQFVHLGIAVSTDRGLAVPVMRNAQNMTFATFETEIKRLAAATRDGKLALHELAGGTFTITNGGTFGSLLSTPIVNPPQSGILGMHAIQKRPVVVNDKIEIRSMMYVALSYDHRIVDGRESVKFLVRLKQYLEDPARLMLEI